jgi:predicted glutamine amidotransferase
MCELLGMSANVPTDICFSFTGLIKRSGLTGPHKDGWGITFYEGKGSRTFRDPAAGVHSEIAKLVQSYPIKSRVVISHIRRANRGRICLENTHPFIRELWGQNWSFAHNGQLKGIKKRKLEFYQPIGTTDSEYAFCWMIGQIRKAYPKKPSSIQPVIALLTKLCADLNTLGVFNMLLSDGEFLYAHCSTHLCWITRKAPFGKATLADADVQVDFQKETSAKDVVSVIATRPLTTNEQWHSIAKGGMKTFHNGIIVGG